VLAVNDVASWIRAWDWSSFLPDSIVAIFIGVIVGFTLFIVQKAQERRLERTRIEVESKRLEHPLTLAIGGTIDGRDYGDFASLTTMQSDALKILERAPIDEWYEKHPTKLIFECFHFQRAALGVRTVGKALAASVDLWLQENGHKVDYGRRYMNERLRDAPRDAMNRLNGESAIKETLDDRVELMLKTERISKGVDALKEAQEYMESVQESLLIEVTAHLRAKESPRRVHRFTFKRSRCGPPNS
jgi:hypothetical protein